MIYCLPLSKSSWIEGRIGPEKYQDCFRIVKISIDLLNKNKIDKILLLTDFKSSQSNKSELEYITEICKRFDIVDNNLHIEKYGYDTLSQLNFALDLCTKNNSELLIISSVLHYPRVRWIVFRLNKKYKVKVTHKVAWGIPRPRDIIFDTALIFLYPIIDLLSFSDRFTKHIKMRRDKGYLL